MSAKTKSLGFLIVGLLVAAPVLAARPVKQPTPAVPVIVDAAGVIVGPVVPVVDGTKAIAAVYRLNGERIKILFDAFTNSATYPSNPNFLESSAISQLRIRGPVALWFPNVVDCSGTGYVQDTDLLEPVGTSFVWNQVITKEYKGYSSIFVYPKSAQSSSAGARLVRVNWSAASAIVEPSATASRLNPNGVCESNLTTVTNVASHLFPVTFEGELNFTGPYSVE